MTKRSGDMEDLPQTSISFFDTLAEGTAGIHLWLSSGDKCVSYLNNYVTPELLASMVKDQEYSCGKIEPGFYDVIQESIADSGVIVLVDDDRANTWERIVSSCLPERRQFAYYLSREQYDLHILGIDELYTPGRLIVWYPPPNNLYLINILHYKFAKFICDELAPLILESREGLSV